MTTPQAEQRYIREHQNFYAGRRWAVVNPRNLAIEHLPIIYGFNNGGPHRFKQAIAVAEDGTQLAEHMCSDESYMEADLGVLEGVTPHNHIIYLKHYPNGYRMEFVSYDDLPTHEKLNKALALYDAKEAERALNHPPA